MPIAVTNPFKWRHFPGEVILPCVRWCLRYPLAYEHVSELLAERGVEVDPSCIWRWVQTYGPELNRRCRPHLKTTNKSYRTDETYIKVKGEDKYLYRAVDSNRANHRLLAHSQAGCSCGETLLSQGSELSGQSRAASD
jgi:transposase, IS6 family